MQMLETSAILVTENANFWFKIFHMPSKREKNADARNPVMVKSWFLCNLSISFQFLRIKDKYFLFPECFSFTPKRLALLIFRRGKLALFTVQILHLPQSTWLQDWAPQCLWWRCLVIPGKDLQELFAGLINLGISLRKIKHSEL